MLAVKTHLILTGRTTVFWKWKVLRCFGDRFVFTDESRRCNSLEIKLCTSYLFYSTAMRGDTARLLRRKSLDKKNTLKLGLKCTTLEQFIKKLSTSRNML